MIRTSIAFYALALIGAGLLSACPIAQPSKPPSTEVDGGDDASDGALQYPACAKACAKLKAFTCPEAETPDGGKTCYRLCADTEESKKFDLKPACIAGATTVEGVRACGTVRCQK